MRVAALYDVHGNVPALNAVLQEIAFEEIDEIVFGGDVGAGPFPRETIELVHDMPNAHYVRGNCDRWMVELFDGEREPTGMVDEWVVGQIERKHRDFLATFEPTVSIDGVLYCHATPHDDEPLFTRATPDERVRELIGDVEQRTVLCGHTHMQFDRSVDGIRIVNAGSIGLPKDRPGAGWALVADGEPELRRTPYDGSSLTQSPWEKVELFLREPNEEETIAFYEAQAAAG